MASMIQTQPPCDAMIRSLSRGGFWGPQTGTLGRTFFNPSHFAPRSTVAAGPLDYSFPRRLRDCGDTGACHDAIVPGKGVFVDWLAEYWNLVAIRARGEI